MRKLNEKFLNIANESSPPPFMKMKEDPTSPASPTNALSKMKKTLGLK